MNGDRNQKLFRSRNNRIIGGVCGGLGEYLEVDPTVVRALFVLLALMQGIGLVLYLFLIILVPTRHDRTDESAKTASHSGTRKMFGITLIVIGGLFLANEVLPFRLLRWDLFLPSAIIFLGIYLTLKKNK